MASMIMNRTWTISTRKRRAETRPASIICPVDFSERDVVALRYAAQLARQRRGKLMVVHVVPSAENSSDAGGAGDTTSEAALARLERFLPLQPGVRCEWIVLQGEVADQIVELAAGCETPQIVMSIRGRGGFGHAFMGRTAEAVLRRAPCPVVMVNDEDLAVGGPSADGVGHCAYEASSIPLQRG